MGLEDARKIEHVFQTAAKWTKDLMFFCSTFQLKIMSKKLELKPHHEYIGTIGSQL